MGRALGKGTLPTIYLLPTASFVTALDRIRDALEAETEKAKAEDGKRAVLGKTVQKSAGHSSLQVTTDRKSRNRRRIAGETLKRAIEEDIKREKP
jgi:hypothetical protein